MRKIIVTLVASFMGLANASDSLTVIGKVIDLKGYGIENAHIITLEENSTYTDVNGEYSIKVSKNTVPVDNLDIIPDNYNNYRIKIFNLLGQKVYDKGYHNSSFINFKWDGYNQSGEQISSGIYFSIVEMNNKIIARSKVTIIGGEILNSRPFITLKPQKNVPNSFAKTTKTNESYIVNLTLTGDNFTTSELLINVNDDNNDGICNADDIEIETYEIDWITDIDGNTCKTVKIGEQWWMAENLKVTHYRNEESISDCWSYNNNDSYVSTYGRLYSWYEVNKHITKNDIGYNIAPSGWHVPTDEEWKELEMALGMSELEANNDGYCGTNEGSKLAGRADFWNDGILENDSEFGTSGFAGLPAGYRGTYGLYSNIGGYAHFWSSTFYGSNVAWGRSLAYNSPKFGRGSIRKVFGFSVRCVRD